MSQENEKLYIGGVDSEAEWCLRCGSRHLDTGWECNDCGYDNMPHYYLPELELQQTKPQALQPVAWIRKNGIRFNAEAEPQDDSETALYSQTAIDTLRAQLAAAQEDSERLDWMIEQSAFVVSDPDCYDGYWLNYQLPDGTLRVQPTEHETPRAAIDAAKGESDG